MKDLNVSSPEEESPFLSQLISNKVGKAVIIPTLEGAFSSGKVGNIGA